MSETATLRVAGNTPRLLEEGAPPPPPPADDIAPPEDAPVAYWTEDKAQNVVAQLCRAGSKFYGPHFKAAEWELELIGGPAAAVLNDWLPLKIGASSDKSANIIALVAVVGIIVALRLPDILEVHGILKPWKPPAERASEQAASQPQQATPPPAPTAQVFEPQLVGGNGQVATSDRRMMSDVFGAQQVGSGGSFAEGA